MTIDTSSIGIREWAGEQSAEIVWEHGTGDQRLRGWERADGCQAIETNGDPVFDGDDGFAEAWADGDDVVWTDYVNIGPSLGDVADEELESEVDRLDDCYTEACRGTRYTIEARKPRRGEVCAMHAVTARGDLQVLGGSIEVPERVQAICERAWELYCDGFAGATTAQQLVKLHPAEALRLADEKAVDHDQDWENQATTFEFADGSKLRISGGHVALCK